MPGTEPALAHFVRQGAFLFSSEGFFRTIFNIKSEPAFRKIKGSGVGRDTITKFLGKNWEDKRWFVQSAIATLNAEKEGSLDRKALETIPTIDQANKFRTEVKRYKIPRIFWLKIY